MSLSIKINRCTAYLNCLILKFIFSAVFRLCPYSAIEIVKTIGNINDKVL